MAPTYGYPGAYQGFIPSFEASGQVISFFRDPKTFKVNEYAQYVPSKKPIGVYAIIDADQEARVVTDDDFVWPDGHEAPQGNDNLVPFVFEDYRCVRRAYPFTLGDETVDNADWKVLAAHAKSAAQQCMTARTMAVQALAQTASNWGPNTSPVQALVPGITGWYGASGDESSPNYLAIKKSLDAAFIVINRQTNGIVQRADLRLVLSPTDAQSISETDEIHQYLKASPFALDQIKGDKPGQNAQWGLPDQLYGFKVVVEDCWRVTSRPLATATAPAGTTAGTGAGTRVSVWQDGSPALLSRPGGLDGEAGPSYSTVQVYFYREMEVQSFDDRINERTMGRVVESRAVVIAAQAAGFLFTNANVR